MKLFFYFVCYLTTLSLLGYCLYLYLRNDDVTEINYKEYNADSQSPYPSFSFCLKLRPNLTQVNSMKDNSIEVNESQYLAFLMGNYWDEEMLNIDYEEVSESLQDYVMIANTAGDFSNVESTGKIISGVKESTLPSYYTIFRCLTFDMPNAKNEKIKFASIVLSNDIFPNGVIPTYDKLVTNFHLPNEMLSKALATKWTWSLKNNPGSNILQLLFTIKSLTIFRRRDKMNNHCIQYDDFDDNYKEAIIAKVGCKPPFWNSNHSYEKCRLAKEHQNISSYAFQGYSGNYATNKLITKQCTELKKLSYKYEDTLLDISKLDEYHKYEWRFNMTENITQFAIVFEDSGIKEIKQVRSFGIESLVGNVGGYIGLFLGFSIIQLPEFCTYLKQKFNFLSERSK